MQTRPPLAIAGTAGVLAYPHRLSTRTLCWQRRSPARVSRLTWHAVGSRRSGRDLHPFRATAPGISCAGAVGFFLAATDVEGQKYSLDAGKPTSASR